MARPVAASQRLGLFLRFRLQDLIFDAARHSSAVVPAVRDKDLAQPVGVTHTQLPMRFHRLGYYDLSIWRNAA